MTSGRKNRIFVQGELAKTKERLAEAEDEFRRFHEANPSILPPDLAAEDAKALSEARAKQLAAIAECEETQRRLESSTGALSQEDRDILSSQVLSDNPALNTLREKLAQLEVQRATLLENVTEKHPDVISIDQEIEKTREKMTSDLKQRITSSQTLSLNPIYQTLQNQVVTLTVDREGLAARDAALGETIGNMERGMTRMAAKQLHYVRLAREAKALEMVYTTLVGEYSKAQINEAREASNFQVLDWAETPKTPTSPRPKLTVAAALLCGLILGSLLAILQAGTTRRNRKVMVEQKIPVASREE